MFRQVSWHQRPHSALTAGSRLLGVLTWPSLWVSPAARAYSQGLDGLQRGKEPLADGLQLVVIEREQVEVLQVLERVHPQAADLVGVEEAASTREAGDPLILSSASGQGGTCGACRPPRALGTAAGSCRRAERKGDLCSCGHRNVEDAWALAGPGTVDAVPHSAIS